MNVSKNTMQKAIHEDLWYKSYVLKIRQQLTDVMKAKRVVWCELLLISLKHCTAGRTSSPVRKSSRSRGRWTRETTGGLPMTQVMFLSSEGASSRPLSTSSLSSLVRVISCPPLLLWKRELGSVPGCPTEQGEALDAGDGQGEAVHLPGGWCTSPHITSCPELAVRQHSKVLVKRVVAPKLTRS